MSELGSGFYLVLGVSLLAIFAAYHISYRIAYRRAHDKGFEVAYADFENKLKLSIIAKYDLGFGECGRGLKLDPPPMPGDDMDTSESLVARCLRHAYLAGYNDAKAGRPSETERWRSKGYDLSRNLPNFSGWKDTPELGVEMN